MDRVVAFEGESREQGDQEPSHAGTGHTLVRIGGQATFFLGEQGFRLGCGRGSAVRCGARPRMLSAE